LEDPPLSAPLPLSLLSALLPLSLPSAPAASAAAVQLPLASVLWPTAAAVCSAAELSPPPASVASAALPPARPPLPSARWRDRRAQPVDLGQRPLSQPLDSEDSEQARRHSERHPPPVSDSTRTTSEDKKEENGAHPFFPFFFCLLPRSLPSSFLYPFCRIFACTNKYLFVPLLINSHYHDVCCSTVRYQLNCSILIISG
jgi:hypothetical protein